MIDELDVVPVRVEHIRSIIIRVMLAKAGRHLVAAAGFKRHSIASVHDFLITGLQRKMKVGCPRRALNQDQVVSNEPVLALSRDRYFEDVQHSPVKLAARLEILDRDIHVVDEPAPVELHDLLLTLVR